MTRRKGKAARGKSRASQAPMEHIDRPSRGTYVVLDLMESSATGHYPWCALAGADLGPSGDARTTERAAVEPAPPATV